MGVSYLSISAVSTISSFIGLQCWIHKSLERMTSDGVIIDNLSSFKNSSSAIELFLGSQITFALAVLVIINVFILLVLCLKTLFFSELQSYEIRKLAERLINYIVYKGTFLPLVVPPTLFHGGVWSTWLAVLCSMKMFQALARDRLERLNASPSVTPWTYFRVYSALLLVFFGDLLWIRLCLALYLRTNSSTFFLLFFEPLSIAFETLQAIVVHGFQLLDIWLHHSAGISDNCRISKLLDISATGSLAEWKGILTRHLGFFLDLMTLFMALAHYLHIWWLHGMAFHLVDAVLFLNIRALLSAMAKRMKGYINLRKALSTLHGALPDATSDELQTYDDECAICREPMSKAKKLSCTHLFHLACLRSWFDQGLSENYSCPTCRKPLFTGRPENVADPQAAEISNDEQLARQINAALNRPTGPGRAPSSRNHTDQIPNPPETRDWRGTGGDTSWLGLDGAGPSTGVRSVGFGRVQMMMRHLAAVGETYAQTALEDGALNIWHMNPSLAGTSNQQIPPADSIRYAGNGGGLHLRRASNTVSDGIANLLSMAETVREVLPHVPDEVILQDLQRTNSVPVTVNNLLQMQ
ncbi:hypothetical protein Leryth_022378 [Lithospermum erythrorhizon]|nr:hypothetical protein Leryth_022378 [Lithospermum erythrorhizon]